MRRRRSTPARRVRARTGRSSRDARSSARTQGRPSVAGSDLGDQRGLVIAAPPFTLGMDGHRHDEVGPDPDPRPATGDGRPERLGKAALPGVLQVVQRAPDRRPHTERTTRAGGAARGCPPGRPIGVPPGCPRRASRAGRHVRAEWLALVPAARTGRGQRHVEYAGHEASERGHGPMMAGPAAPGLTRARPRSRPRPPVPSRSGRPRPSRSARSSRPAAPGRWWRPARTARDRSTSAVRDGRT